MLDALYYYVVQKLPAVIIQEALQNRSKFEVHGIYPTYAKDVLKNKGYKNIREIDFFIHPKEKNYNSIRPSFFWAKNKQDDQLFIMAVTPGKDYLTHYVELLRFLLTQKGGNPDKIITIYRYPKAEATIADWTSLNSDFINNGDIVIIGYVDEIRKRLMGITNSKILSSYQNEFYGSERLEISSNKTVCFLGVSYSFWGRTITPLVERFCQLGASKIVYLSKVGTLTSPNDIYDRLFAPSKFISVQHDRLIDTIETLKNSFCESNPSLDSGTHASVPTVMEETFLQYRLLVSEGVGSIDNEVFQMAYAINKWNQDKTNKDVDFGSIHFATDYLHDGTQGSKNNFPNLSNNRTTNARKKKEEILITIANELVSCL